MKKTFSLPGWGLLQGMAVTARNFIGSFYDPARLATVSYPEEKMPLPENSRNFPFLVYDGDDAEEGLRCVVCRICEKECPPQVISMAPATDEKGKALKRPKVFDIDTNACMSCQICVEVCPFDAIKMDSAYEYAEVEHFHALIHHLNHLAKPNSYFHAIKPTEAAEVDGRLEAERARKEAARLKKEEEVRQKKEEAARESQ
jgi:NADH-quinone oxidoreductase subunit I